MSHRPLVDEYVDSILDGRKVACKENIQAVKRYRKTLADPEYDFREGEAEFIIDIIEKTFKLIEGEDKDGRSFRGRPFILEPWQLFIVYNLCGFFYAGTELRLYDEAFIFIPRKNGKTMLISALSWAFSCRYATSNSKLYLTSTSLKQSKLPFEIIKQNLDMMGILKSFRVRDNNQEHVISGAIAGGSITIEALAGSPKNKQGFNSNISIADEIHEYVDAEQYNAFKQSMMGYRNKLMIAITTAGDNMTSFCYYRLKTCQAILDGTESNDRYFIFITKADENEQGEVDYLDPANHEKANPNYGVTIMPREMIEAANMAKMEPQQRKSFLSRHLNIYTASMKAYFDISVFQRSDGQHNWSLDQLAKLGLNWYAGVDLSAIKDLTAACLAANYQGVDIIIPHAWFPVLRAHEKADKDHIPLFGWQDDGWLTMCNDPTINSDDVVIWFEEMKKRGFKIVDVRYDVRFAADFVESMRKAKFKITNQPQMWTQTTVGFNRIDRSSENGTLYYLHSDAFEYCVQGVKVNDKPGGFKEFEKIGEHTRIDIFAAAVFAITGMVNGETKKKEKRRLLRG